MIDRNQPNTRINDLERLAAQGAVTITTDLQTKVFGEIVKEEVGPLLNQEIADCSPDVIIIHGGSVFNQVPGAYRAMIIGLKKQHPDLPFALEGKHEWLTRWPRSTYALLERKGAHIDDDELAYWVNHNFIDDDEVDKIIKVIFL